MDDALAIVRKGLESIQSLHQQTAQAHQKFLETQAMAGRTLEEMMKSTRLFVESTMGGTPRLAMPNLAPRSETAAVPVAEGLESVKPAEAPVLPATPVQPSSIATSLQTNPAGDQHPAPAMKTDAIATTLIDIVAELTGYPQEMLGLEMDIEADLGIDSIKRVEILSAMEERMPHLPQVTPDMVGTLKTLGQICDFLSAGTPSAATPPSGATTKPAVAPSASADTTAIQQTLIDIVAELTGYPQEMLGLEMDIEADLGIDSIKRVEILSAMEERMPHLPQVTPDMVGTLKTLGQICDFLSAGAPSAAPATKPAAAPSASADTTAIHQTLIDIVAELTGYPQEMLGLEMDIEADLGIDSIKRVEILSAMEERMPQLPQVTPDMVGTLKTLGQICDFLAGGHAAAALDNGPPSVVPPPESPCGQGSSDCVIPREVVDVIRVSKPAGRPIGLAANRNLVVVHKAAPLAQALVAHFKANGVSARSMTPDEITGPETFTGSAGVLLCSDVDPETAFIAAKHAAAELDQAASEGDALFASVSQMDGAFGFSGNLFSDPEQGALGGLVKTAALEWEKVICRTIDLSPDIPDIDTAARLVVEELLTVTKGDPTEVGLSGQHRLTLFPVPAEVVEGDIHLEKNDVVVVTGGARGVTAACGLALARSNPVTLALIGRSAPPVDVPAWLDGIEEPAAMKKAIAANGFAGTRPTPKDLEAVYRSYSASRAITRALDALKATGVRAAYFSADVTDAASIKKTIAAIRSQMGPIRGLIHGAGVLHDRLIRDKTVDQFREVYATKVDGLKNVLAAMESDDLRHLVIFSSVSARTGNIGQCDYAMANEVLNKLARREALRRGHCHVTAINWGPWDGGMVTSSLKKAFADKQIDLIPLDVGAAMMVAEMKNADPRPVEVIIGSMLTTESTASTDSLALLERREVNLKRYPVLSSHIIDGRPVVPFALISEWIGHGALKGNPGYCLHGIDDFRLLSGIRVETGDKLVRLMAGKAQATEGAWQVDVELRNGVKHGKDVIHSRAKALLVDHLPAAPPFKANGNNGSRPYPHPLDTIYGDILFHGDQLRAIQSIDAYSDHGMTARLIAAPTPETWMEDPIREHWNADPMVLDGAFQMAILWCFDQTGSVCLPSYARAYRQYRPSFPQSGVSAVMTVTAHHHRKMVADFTFLDEAGQVVATLEGYEATVDANLIHAFRNNGMSPAVKGDPA
ncbi:SDR family NAD(P)-dependent oxidoreductase [Desulfosarcina cetonica]|uniref:SDR family NAD(P)-dependent oxidoreductase n=1 Tax=Desulfosarcina cetonica TaxID=90730 RepID=UPI0006D1FB73|nr:SDR family NAD(P)-dependent oxidoreductase [Desulfosarcina cetonica]